MDAQPNWCVVGLVISDLGCFIYFCQLTALDTQSAWEQMIFMVMRTAWSSSSFTCIPVRYQINLMSSFSCLERSVSWCWPLAPTKQTNKQNTTITTPNFLNWAVALDPAVVSHLTSALFSQKLRIFSSELFHTLLAVVSTWATKVIFCLNFGIL